MKPNDPLFNNQWGLMQIGAPLAWDIEKGNDNVIIVIIDSGMPNDGRYIPSMKTHEDLQNARLIACLDARKQTLTGIPNDNRGHGTKVLGVVAADSTNGIGIAGMNWYSKVLIYKVFDDLGKNDRGDTLSALQFAEDIAEYSYGGRHVVINLSLSKKNDSHGMHDQIDRMCRTKGMVICAAVGNDDGPVRIPAKYSLEIPGIIAVGSLDNQSDSRSTSSNKGPELTVLAPGQDILTTSLGPMDGGLIRSYIKFSGTSAATPFVTGLVSLIWSKYPELTNVQVVDVIKNTAFKVIGRNYPNPLYGYGRIDADAAMRQAGRRIDIESPNRLEFADVKTGESKTMEIKFSVNSFHATTFEITSLSDGFQASEGASISIGKTTDYYTRRYACLKIMHTGRTAGDHPSGKATVRCRETGEEWNIELSANTVA